MPFPRVFVLYEMQSASSKIWTRIAVSIFYNDNHYTTGTSLPIGKNGKKESKESELSAWVDDDADTN